MIRPTPSSDDDGLANHEISTGPLRARVAMLDDAAKANLFQVWAQRGLPPARDEDGNDVWIDARTHRIIAGLLQPFEETATKRMRELLRTRIGTLTSEERSLLDIAAHAHDSTLTSMLATTGFIEAMGLVMDEITVDTDEDDAPVIPLPDRPADIVHVPLDEPGDIDLTPPTGTVADVMWWVGTDPARARAALDAEHEGKARKSLISKLIGLAAPKSAVPAPTGGSVTVTEPEPAQPTTTTNDDAIAEAKALLLRVVALLTDLSTNTDPGTTPEGETE